MNNIFFKCNDISFVITLVRVVCFYGVWEIPMDEPESSNNFDTVCSCSRES